MTVDSVTAASQYDDHWLKVWENDRSYFKTALIVHVFYELGSEEYWYLLWKGSLLQQVPVLLLDSLRVMVLHGHRTTFVGTKMKRRLRKISRKFPKYQRISCKVANSMVLLTILKASRQKNFWVGIFLSNSENFPLRKKSSKMWVGGKEGGTGGGGGTGEFRVVTSCIDIGLQCPASPVWGQCIHYANM